MNKCLECGELYHEPAILVNYAGESLHFCSFECLIAHSVTRLCRRIARENRRVQRFVKRRTACESIRTGRTAKRPVS
jgi:hypothetical protein